MDRWLKAPMGGWWKLWTPMGGHYRRLSPMISLRCFTWTWFRRIMAVVFLCSLLSLRLRQRHSTSVSSYEYPSTPNRQLHSFREQIPTTLRDVLHFWDILNTPTGSCAKKVGFGGTYCKTFDDGRKQLCLDNDEYLPRDSSCLVYSFGISLDTTFEDAVSYYLPECQIHMFDPSVNQTDFTKELLRPRQSFHLFGIANQTKIYKNVYQVYPLAEIRKMLGHQNKTIHVLKMDVEGFEWEVLKNLYQEKQLDSVMQIDMELHLDDIMRNPIERWLPLMQKVSSFSTENIFHLYRKYL